jgi:hypothetical protein
MPSHFDEVRASPKLLHWMCQETAAQQEFWEEQGYLPDFQGRVMRLCMSPQCLSKKAI